MKNATEILNTLNQFTGTEHYYKHFMGLTYTDGINYLAESCECYWLLDIVASYQSDTKMKKQPFQVYKMKVNPSDSSAIIKISDGDNHILATQEIGYTDFPLSEIELWCIEKILILPMEY